MANQKSGATRGPGNESNEPARVRNLGDDNSLTSGSKRLAPETASTMASQVQDVLDQQVAKGAQIVSNVAQSARRAADDLDENPQVADLVRGMANRLEEYSRTLERQSVTDLYEAATDFTRRQPALVFGMAALAGFFTLRTLRSSQLDPGPHSPTRNRAGAQREKIHGS